MAQERIRLGELLVQASLITQQQLDETLALQKQDGRRLGTLIVEQGLVTEFNVAQILSQQLSVPWVALQHIDFSSELLTLVPADLAERYCLIPIYVRRVRGLGNVLYVAMDDPTNQQAIDAVSKHASLPVRTMIAPPSDIRDALYGFYGVGEPVYDDTAPPPSTSFIAGSGSEQATALKAGASQAPSAQRGAAGVDTAEGARLRLQWNEFLGRGATDGTHIALSLQDGRVLTLSIPQSDGQFAELPIAQQLVAALSVSGAQGSPDWQTLLGRLIAALIDAGIVVDLTVQPATESGVS